MITDVYSHILDEDRRFNAQKFEEQFYNIKGIKVDEDTRVPVQKFDSLILNKKKAAHREKNDNDTKAGNSSDVELLNKLLNNPETAAQLKVLAKNM